MTDVLPRSARPFFSSSAAVPATRTFFLLLLLGVALRIYTASWYDPFTQHDPDKHLATLRGLIELNPEKDYNAPYYYILVALLCAPLSALFRLHLIGGSKFFTIATAWSGIVLQAFYMYGCLLLARRLRFRVLAQYFFVALCVFFPPIQRTFAMLRPEVLILALCPFACSYLISVCQYTAANMQPVQIRRVWPAIVALALMAGQKIVGVFLVIGLGVATLAMSSGGLLDRIRYFLRPALFCLALIILLFAAQRAVTGVWFFQHHQLEDSTYQAKPTLALFTSFSFEKMWSNPFRNEHAGSMLNILFVDMFGDYWRYGMDHYARDKAVSQTQRLFRARLGLVLSALFLALYAAGLLALGMSAARQYAQSSHDVFVFRLIFAALFYIGMATLILAAFAGYNEGKFDIIKWEYISPFIPFLMIPVAHLVDRACARDARAGWASAAVVTLCFVIVSFGIVQSIPSPRGF